MKGEVTLRDIAKLAGVSVNTTSRAINNREGVNPKTRERIIKLAMENSYRPNIMARTMRGVQSNMIGTLIGDITDHFFVQLLSGVEEEIGRELMPIVIGNTGEDLRKQKESLNLLLSYGCKSIIITPVSADTDFINTLRDAGVAFVIADRVGEGMEGCNQVSINNRRDAYRAVEYLIQCGHRRIAMLNQRSEVRTETDRTLGYREAMTSNGLPINEAHVVQTRSRNTVSRDIQALLEGTDRPTALFIAKDTLALNAVSTINDCGLSIPDDISVFIYGSPEWSQSLQPHFTCMERAVKDIGRTSARILIGHIKGNAPAAPVNIQFDSNLVIRDSVRLI